MQTEWRLVSGREERKSRNRFPMGVSFTRCLLLNQQKCYLFFLFFSLMSCQHQIMGRKRTHTALIRILWAKITIFFFNGNGSQGVILLTLPLINLFLFLFFSFYFTLLHWLCSSSSYPLDSNSTRNPFFSTPESLITRLLFLYNFCSSLRT